MTPENLAKPNFFPVTVSRTFCRLNQGKTLFVNWLRGKGSLPPTRTPLNDDYEKPLAIEEGGTPNK